MKDIYMKFSGPAFQGESADNEHGGWIEISEWAQGITQPRSMSASSAGGHTSERTEHDPMKFLKEMDSISPILYQHCSGGTTFDEVIIDFMRADDDGKRVKYMEIKLKKVIISTIDTTTGGKEEKGVPREEFTLKYAAINWTYTKQGIGGKAEGTTVGSWSLTKNMPNYTV